MATDLIIQDQLIGHRTFDHLQSNIVVQVETQPVTCLKLQFRVQVIFAQIILYLIQQTFLISVSHTDIVVHFVRTALYTQIVRVTDRLVFEIIVKPVCITVLIVISSCPVITGSIRFYSRKFSRIRVLHKSLDLFDSLIRNLLQTGRSSSIIILLVIICCILQRIHHLRHVDR